MAEFPPETMGGERQLHRSMPVGTVQLDGLSLSESAQVISDCFKRLQDRISPPAVPEPSALERLQGFERPSTAEPRKPLSEDHARFERIRQSCGNLGRQSLTSFE